MLVAIALDRHRAITRPLVLPGSPNWLVAASWLGSLIPSLPSFSTFHLELVQDRQQLECINNFDTWTSGLRLAYFTGVAVFVFFIPLLLFIGLYSHIIYELRAAASDLKKTPGQEGSCYHPRQNLLSRARVKTTNLSMAVVVTFLLTNLPYILTEFKRQWIVPQQQCNTTFCQVIKVKVQLQTGIDTF